MKKPLDIQRLKGGAGEEGRTPDLMLGNHGRQKKLANAKSVNPLSNP